jgi:hypothetical protein
LATVIYVNFEEPKLGAWLSKREIAAGMGRSVSWVGLQAAAGMPSALIGGRRVFPVSEALSWLAGRPQSRRFAQHIAELQAVRGRRSGVWWVLVEPQPAEPPVDAQGPAPDSAGDGPEGDREDPPQDPAPIAA